MGLLVAWPVLAEDGRPRSPDSRVELGVSTWHQRLTGSVRGVRDARNGVGDVQPDRDTSLGYRARLGRWNLGFTRINHEAVGSAVRTLRFRGVTFAQNDGFRLSHRLSFLDMFYNLETKPDGALRGEFQLGLKVTKITTQLLNLKSQDIASIRETVPVPHLGLRLQVGRREDFHGFLRAHFTELSHQDVDVRMSDFAVGLEGRVGTGLLARLGWRQLSLEVNVLKRPGREGRLDFRNTGLFFEIGRRF